jgi:HPt (histidine-containing phosphotransfer) domain-containing protein
MRWKLLAAVSKKGAAQIAAISRPGTKAKSRRRSGSSETERVTRNNSSQKGNAMQNPVQNTVGLAFNFADLLDRVENDHELLRELLAIFKQDYPRLLLSLKEGVLRSEMKRIQASSHALRGMLSNLAMARAADAAANLEKLGRNGERAGLKDALALLEQELSDLIPAVDRYLQGAQ